QVAREHHPIVALAVVVGVRRRAIKVLCARAVVDTEPDGPVERHALSIAVPRDRLDPAYAPRAQVPEPLVVRPPPAAAAPPVRIGRDHVDVARRRVVLADERHDEAGQPTPLLLGGPRRAPRIAAPQK